MVDDCGKESPEEYLIRTIREMQKHHLSCIREWNRVSSLDGSLNITYHHNMYGVLTELIDLYDDAVAEQNQPSEVIHSE